VTCPPRRVRTASSTCPSPPYSEVSYNSLHGGNDESNSKVHDVSDAGAHADTQNHRLPEALLERLEDENDFLRRELGHLHQELERKDAILLILAQRVPKLEHAPNTFTEPSGIPVTPSENGGDPFPAKRARALRGPFRACRDTESNMCESLERERERADAAEVEARELRAELERSRRSWW